MSVTNDVVTDQRVNKVARTLRSIGAEITVIGRKRRNSIPFKPDKFNVKLFRLIINKGPLFYAVYNLRAFFYLVSHRFDILVANDLDTLPANYLASKIKRAKLVYDSHEYFTEVPELQGRKFVQKTWKLIERFILPKIKYACTVNDSIARIYCRKYGVKMLTIRNLPYCNQQEENADIYLTYKGKLILYQGSVNMGRGLELVIKSMKHVNNATFLIIGDGYIMESLKQLCTDLNLHDKILFTGRMPFNKLSSYTKKADLGISLEENLGLNYYYALPNKLFDYIKANVPVLVSDFPEMGKIVKKYDIGLTTLSTDPLEIAGLINYMLNDQDNIRKWKKNLLNATKDLCWESEEQKLKEMYKTIISA